MDRERIIEVKADYLIRCRSVMQTMLFETHDPAARRVIERRIDELSQILEADDGGLFEKDKVGNFKAFKLVK